MGKRHFFIKGVLAAALLASSASFSHKKEDFSSKNDRLNRLNAYVAACGISCEESAPKISLNGGLYSGATNDETCANEQRSFRRQTSTNGTSVSSVSSLIRDIVCTPQQNELTSREFYIGGMPAGFTLGVGGAQVVTLSQVMSDTSSCSPAANAGIKTGDVIEKVNGERVLTTEELNEKIEFNKQKSCKLTVLRQGERIEIAVTPVKDRVTGRYKIGVLARDSVSGIGTITYIEKTTLSFGSLGHPVGGEENIEFCGGDICSCSIINVKKGVRGHAGELRAAFIGSQRIGKGEKVTDCGIFGTMDTTYSLTGNVTAYAAPINEVQIGDAYVYSTVEGERPEKYSMDVVKVERHGKGNKDFVVKITDKRLLEKTGGIVQGMSGSPIVQNGKLIGAITHVFVNDPTRGYGVSIERMLTRAAE